MPEGERSVSELSPLPALSPAQRPRARGCSGGEVQRDRQWAWPGDGRRGLSPHSVGDQDSPGYFRVQDRRAKGQARAPCLEPQDT